MINVRNVTDDGSAESAASAATARDVIDRRRDVGGVTAAG